MRRLLPIAILTFYLSILTTVFCRRVGESAPAFVPVGNVIIPAYGFGDMALLGGGGYNTLRLVTDNNDVACALFTVPDTGYITHIGFLTTTVTSAADMTASLNTFDADLRPAGLERAGDSGTANIAAIGWNYITLVDSQPSAGGMFPQGYKVCACVRRDTVDAGGDVTIARTVGTTAFGVNWPYNIHRLSTTTWVRTNLGRPVMAIKMTGSFGTQKVMPTGMFVADSQLGVIANISGSSAAGWVDEVGMSYRARCAGEVSGVQIRAAAVSSSNIFPSMKLWIWGSDGNLYDTISYIEGTGVSATQDCAAELYFRKPLPTYRSQSYKFSITAINGDDSIRVRYFKVPDSTDLEAYPFGYDYYMIQRADAGSWTYMPNYRLFMSLIFSSLSADAGTARRRKFIEWQNSYLWKEAQYDFAGSWWDEVAR